MSEQSENLRTEVAAPPRDRSFMERLIALEEGMARVQRNLLLANLSCEEPHLGLATNRQLVEELAIRYDMGFTESDYRTVDDG